MGKLKDVMNQYDLDRREAETEIQKQGVLEAVRGSNARIKVILEKLGIKRVTFDKWLMNPRFKEAYYNAREDYHQFVMKQLAEKAVSKSISEGNGRLALDYLRFRHSDEYGTSERVQSEVTQNVQLYIPKNGTEKVEEHKEEIEYDRD